MAKMITKREAEKVSKHSNYLVWIVAFIVVQVAFDVWVLWH